MNRRDGGQPSKLVQPYVPWLDEETLTEIMPEAVILGGAGRPKSRETTLTFIQNESTDDI